MLQNKKIEFSQESWKRINMRSVSHLLGVEFMHNLYNRHLPRINSIRFRNTIVSWRDGQVNSYAPKEEWDALAHWFGRKFLKLDNRLLQQVKSFLTFDRSFYNSFIYYLEKLNLKKLPNVDLGLALIDLQDYTLGELYQVNLVQIEHALTYAIRTLLGRHEKNEAKRNRLFASLIVAKDLTESQKEDLGFEGIVRFGLAKKASNPKKNKEVVLKIKNHWKQYAFMHCAYGELPHEISFYFDKYENTYQKQKLVGNELIESINKRYRDSVSFLRSLRDERLRILVPLMVQVGVFRDFNKAQLGKTIKYKLNILDEIARRKLESRDALNYYLLFEMLDLLEGGKRVTRKEIHARKTLGVRLVRKEYLEVGSLAPEKDVESFNGFLRGVCASGGVVIGNVSIVLNKNDAKKVKKGDIMVAIGTDFDLMGAIQTSSAVITEEGGLLSHAAVVCREMMKPCCIGVPHATKILKDGMKVKVDANNGIIIVV